MPLRDDLLEPIPGDNPAGPNLYYDKVFDQIKDARIEEDDSGSAGAWERTAKKADHVLVIKLAGETLAKRTKDLRLAGWLIESHLKREGLLLLPACLELLWKLQEDFWETIHPEIEEDGDVGLRVSAIEGPVNRIGSFLATLPVTRAGMGAALYLESRRVGYEEAADTSDKQKARQDAMEQGQVTAEAFDAAFAATSKATFVALDEVLASSLDVLDQMSAFQEGKYGDDYPGMNKLVTAVQQVKQVVSALLNERRKTDPDPVAVQEEESDAVAEEEPETFADEPPAEPVAAAAGQQAAPAPAKGASRSKGFQGLPETAEQATSAILEGVRYLHGQDPASPVAYLVCAGLRLGETRARGGMYDPEFVVAPSTETRQALRRLLNDSDWNGLMTLGLNTLAEPCARAWLDLQRYLWRAASGLGANALATAILSTVRSLLLDIPELRSWSLDDDTPVANAETQQWIDAEILPPPAVVVEETPDETPAPVYTPPAADANEPAEPGIYEQATALLDRGRSAEAIAMLVRDAEIQPSGRMRFQRRVQVAQLCLQAGQGAVAYPLLTDLSKEVQRRALESWETGEMLAHPLALLLQCMDQRTVAAEDRDQLFDRLCCLDPKLAMTVQR